MNRIPTRKGTAILCGAVICTLGTLLALRLVANDDVPEQIISKARDAVSFANAGPFEMKVEIRLASAKSEEKGTYLLDWAAPDKFREEIHFPGYDELKIALGNTLYRKRSLNYTPLDAFRIEELMRPDELIGQFQRDAERAQTRFPAIAAQVAGPSDPSHQPLLVGRFRGNSCVSIQTVDFEQLCVDAKRDWPINMSLRNTADDEMIKWGDYKNISSGSVARQRQYFIAGRLVAEADLKQLSKDPDFAGDTFTPTSGAEHADWCSDELTAELVPLKAPFPITADDFPNSDVLDAFVSPDGTTRMQIIASGGPQTDAAVQKLTKIMHFIPATCHGKPIASEKALVLSSWDLLDAEYPRIPNVPEGGKNGYTDPQCAYCPAPQYADKAFKAKIQGPVVLKVIIFPDGRAHYVQVVKHLDDGLDQQAVHSIRDLWRFKPALGPDGKPAAVRMLIEIDFNLY